MWYVGWIVIRVIEEASDAIEGMVTQSIKIMVHEWQSAQWVVFNRIVECEPQ